MNTELMRKNIKWSILTTMLGAIGTLLARKMFVSSFPQEYLALQNIIANILILAGFFDLEVESYCNYRIMTAFARQQDISKAISLSDKIMKLAGKLVLIAGVLISPLLKVFIKLDVPWTTVYAVYFLQLLSLALPYFFYVYRLVQRAAELEYQQMIIATGLTFTENILKSLILYLTKNFILFALLEPITTLLIKLLNKNAVEKKLGIYLPKEPVKIKDDEQKEIKQEIRNLLPSKLGYVINDASQDLILASVNEIDTLSLASNYKYIFKCINSFIDRLYSYAKGAVGKFAVTKEDEEYNGYKTISMMVYLCASLLFSCYCVLCTDFIKLFFGESYTLPVVTAFLLYLAQLIDWSTVTPVMYRGSIKNYKVDSKWVLFSSISALTLSLLLSQVWGVNGIIAGALIGTSIRRLGRLNAVFAANKEIKKEILKSYLIKFAIALLQAWICIMLTKNITVSWINLIVKGLIVFLISLFMDVVIFGRQQEFRRIIRLIKKW